MTKDYDKIFKTSENILSRKMQDIYRDRDHGSCYVSTVHGTWLLQGGLLVHLGTVALETLTLDINEGIMYPLLSSLMNKSLSSEIVQRFKGNYSTSSKLLWSGFSKKNYLTQFILLRLFYHQEVQYFANLNMSIFDGHITEPISEMQRYIAQSFLYQMGQYFKKQFGVRYY